MRVKRSIAFVACNWTPKAMAFNHDHIGHFGPFPTIKERDGVIPVELIVGGRFLMEELW